MPDRTSHPGPEPVTQKPAEDPRQVLDELAEADPLAHRYVVALAHLARLNRSAFIEEATRSHPPTGVELEQVTLWLEALVREAA